MSEPKKSQFRRASPTITKRYQPPYTTLRQPESEKLQTRPADFTLKSLPEEELTTTTRTKISEGLGSGMDLSIYEPSSIQTQLNQIADQVLTEEKKAELEHEAQEQAQTSNTTSQLKQDLTKWKKEEAQNLNTQLEKALQEQGITKQMLQSNAKLRRQVTEWKRKNLVDFNTELAKTEQEAIAERQETLKTFQQEQRTELKKSFSEYETGVTKEVQSSIKADIAQVNAEAQRLKTVQQQKLTNAKPSPKVTTILAQNKRFDQALKNKEITPAEYNNAMAFQNIALIDAQNERFKEALNKGEITVEQYNSVIPIQSSKLTSAIQTQKLTIMSNVGWTGSWDGYVKNVEEQKTIVSKLESANVIKVTGNKIELTKSVTKLSTNELSQLQKIGMTVSQSTITYQSALDKLKNSGVVIVVNDQIQLKTSLQNLPDELYEAAKIVGFRTTDVGKGLSFAVYDWMKQNAPQGLIPALIDMATGKKPGTTKAISITGGLSLPMIQPLGRLPAVEKPSIIIGGIEQATLGTIGWAQSLLTGKNSFDYRTVTPETIEYTRGLDPTEKINLQMAGLAGYALGTYVLTAGTGFVADMTLAGAKNIAVGIAGKVGVTMPLTVAKIASTVASHPRLAQLVVYGTMVGLSAPEMAEMYNRYQSGLMDFDDFTYKIAQRGTGIIVGIKGFETGAKGGRALREWWNTRGRTLIQIQELMRPETIQTGKLPTYSKNLPQTKWSREYKELAKKLTAEGYLGQLAPDEYRLWHGSGDVWKYRLNEMTTVQTGESLNKFPGLFLSPEPSPLRLGGTSSFATSPSKIGLPGTGTNAYLLAIDAYVDVMPSGLSRTELWSWLLKQVGSKTTYIPPVGMITPEMESILPVGTKIINVGKGWYTNFGGHRILVDKWVIVPNEVASQIISTGLPKGMVLSTLGEVVSRSTTSVADKILAFGLIPTSSTYSSTELSPQIVTNLAKEYNISETEVRSIVSSLGYTRSDLSSSLTPSSSTPLSPQEISSLVTPTSLAPSSMPLSSDFTPSSIPPSSIPPSGITPSSTPPSSVPPSSVPPSEIPPSSIPPIPPIKPGFNGRTRGGKIVESEFMKIFDVILQYYSTSEQFKIRANSFRSASFQALQRRKNKEIPEEVIVTQVGYHYQKN